MKTCVTFALITTPTLLPQGEGLKTPLPREVGRKQEKVQWTCSPPNGRRRFFCARAGSRGDDRMDAGGRATHGAVAEGWDLKQDPIILLETLSDIAPP